VLIYGSVLLAIAVAFLVSLSMRSPLKVDVVRDRASLARLVDEGRIENVYRLQLMNATERQQRYRVTVSGIEGAQVSGPAEVDVGPAQSRWMPVAVRIPPEAAQAIGPGAHPIRFEIVAVGPGEGAARALQEKSTFVVPR
jgi:polyferredoxin